MMTVGMLVALGAAVLCTVIYAFGVRGIALLYPAGDSRRAELIAERYKVPRKERLFWIFEQFETALMEGREARAEARRAKASESAPKEGSGDAVAAPTTIRATATVQETVPRLVSDSPFRAGPDRPFRAGPDRLFSWAGDITPAGDRITPFGAQFMVESDDASGPMGDALDTGVNEWMRNRYPRQFTGAWKGHVRSPE